jgi:hypothetical protein
MVGSRFAVSAHWSPACCIAALSEAPEVSYIYNSLSWKVANDSMHFEGIVVV